jgi:hypothetical protein
MTNAVAFSFAGTKIPPYLEPPNIYGQDFESGIAQSGWSSIVGTPTFNYQPSIDGRYSLSLGPTSSQEAQYAISAMSELYIYMEIMFTSFHTGDQTFFILYDNAFTEACKVQLLTGTNALLIADTGVAHVAATTRALNPMQQYKLWIHYKAGSGANSTATVGFSDGGPEPVAGANFAGITASGSSTVSPTKLYFQKPSGTNAIVIDRVGISTVAIPNGW